MRSLIFIGVLFLLNSCLDDAPESPLERWRNDVKAIDAYLTQNNLVAVKDGSGVRIVVDELGSGLPPNSDNDIRVKYKGMLFSNRSVFDEGTTTGKLPDYIAGWQAGLSLLPPGSIATLFIPSGYAYGAAGRGSIPPNAILIFDVEVESVTRTAAQISRLKADSIAIDQYLETNEIEAIEDPSGIRYVIEEGSGVVSPYIHSQVRVKLVGKLMSDGFKFFDQILQPENDFSSLVGNYPHGLIVGLQLMKEGDKATFYVPSGLAYGTRSYTGIPPNSNIIFEVELLQVY
ncbi:MAG TPA: FKBP-type peptidyl-prolyl cis-trans isomerase [Cyclobacteriaceae bacterium]|nr:FKBP-type peptidyl-prolyl cis-trans isomerase [Cyclobacteriaceae bacterium]HRJ81305.1 FKBP-type peptidyl-prolyl cis-trans isomerase [Cyclobacteriaceae bacterium]